MQPLEVLDLFPVGGLVQTQTERHKDQLPKDKTSPEYFLNVEPQQFLNEGQARAFSIEYLVQSE